MNEIRLTSMPISGAAKESGGRRAKTPRQFVSEAMIIDAVAAEAINSPRIDRIIGGVIARP